MAEAELYDQVRLAAAQHGCRLFRNNVGVFRTKDAAQRFTRTGLGKGSSDLVGWRMVSVGGQTVAQFVAIEVKTRKGRLRQEQRLFLECVQREGGLAGVVRSVQEAEDLLSMEMPLPVRSFS